MNRKIKKLIMFLIVMLLSISLSSCHKEEIRVYGFYDYVSLGGTIFNGDDHSVIINSYEELQKLSLQEQFLYMLEKYDEEYFERQALGLYSFKQHKGMSYVDVKEITKENETLNLYLDVKPKEEKEYVTASIIIEIYNKEDIQGVNKLTAYHNKYEYAMITLMEPPSGCMIMEYRDYVRIGEEYDLTYAKEYLFSSKFIDCKTLKIYQDSIIVNEDINLLTYYDKLPGDYIRSYVISNGNFEYGTSLYELSELGSYEILENGDIIVKNKEITYTFSQSKQEKDKVYLASIYGERSLFDCATEEIIERLRIMYGSNDYITNEITITLAENSFLITLAEVYRILYG